MSNASKKILLDATAGIREEYIEEAAVPVPKSRPLWVRFAAAAAALALLLGGGLLLWPDGCPETEYTPFFAIRAYAQDGTEATLDSAGDTAPIAVTQSDLFPGKEVYILDVSLTDTQGNRLDLEDSSFRCFHRGKNLEPGQTDENLSVEWVEEDGFHGYRLIGWCDDFDMVDITIKSQDGIILHQKTVRIELDDQYSTNVYSSYTYEPGLTTRQLMEKIFDSGNVYWQALFSSSIINDYTVYVRCYGGFLELEQREDAASLLLERWIAHTEEVPCQYASVDASGTIGMILSQDVYWERLTAEEKTRIAAYGIPRHFTEQNTYDPFPGKQTFHYRLTLDGNYAMHEDFFFDYEGMAEQDWREHLSTMFFLTPDYVHPQFHGWEITGWFDEPTKLTLTVTNKDGTVIRREMLMITPTEDSYQIDILEQTP